MFDSCSLLLLAMEQVRPVALLPAWIEWVLIAAVWGLVVLTYLPEWRERARRARMVLPGTVSRPVTCPVRGRSARIEVLYTEPVWGTLQATDIIRCSLFGRAPVSCHKNCLSQL